HILCAASLSYFVKDSAELNPRRIGLAFHEGFPFVRSAVAEVISLSGRKANDIRLNFDLLRKETNLGRNYAKAMPRYCQCAGLLDHKNELTTLGRRLYECDRHLERPETLWLCHYNLAAPEGPGPQFWHVFVGQRLLVGDILKTMNLGEVLKRYCEESGNPIVERTAVTAASVFLGTYSRPDCLGGLGILEAQQDAGTYLVKEIESPPPLVFALAVANYWKRNLNDQRSVWIDEFNKAGGPAQVLLMGRGQVNHAMRELSSMGLATVQLNQAPYQFSPLWRDSDELLYRIYDK
ncbi:MAG: DUF4007 family protein, partial [Verrucomicrobiota bacterium]